MSKLPAKQINAPIGQGAWRTGAVLPTSGTSMEVSAHFSGKTSGGSDSQIGVYTQAPQNKIHLRRESDGKPIVDSAASGKTIFARLTEAAGVWTLTFYTQASGVETAFNFAGHADANANFAYRWCETVQLANVSPTSVVEAGEAIDEFQASSPLLHSHPDPVYLTVTSNGQTAFTLPFTPKFNNGDLFVNGQLQALGAGKDYEIDGLNLTWLNRQFLLSTTDELEFKTESAQ